MGNVAKLFPYRDSNGRLLFRGKVGCKKADGVTEGVSKFFPVRVDGRLLLRGKGPDGKIRWGYPYRDSDGRLMGRTIRIRSGFTTPCGCTACHIVVTLSGFPDGFGPGGNPPYGCNTADFTGMNGTHTLTLDGGGCIYHKRPADSYWSPYSGCTIAETFPAAGTQIGPYIYVRTRQYGGTDVDIVIHGKAGISSFPCRGKTSIDISGCGGLADHIGHTWYVPFLSSNGTLNFTGAVRLDALL